MSSGMDMGSFAAFYKKHYRYIFGVCFHVAGNVADAEDLTQDVFLQVQKHFASFRGRSAITSWLYRISVNQALMKLRRVATRLERVSDSGKMPEPPRAQQAFHQQIVDRLALDRAINTLPAGYRKVFLLHDVAGYDHNEVARILGVTPGTSKSQLHKARHKLRLALLDIVQQETAAPASEAAHQFAAAPAW